MTAIVAPGQTFTLTTNIDNITTLGSAQVNGIIDFGGGTAAAAGTTMNLNDTITGTTAASTDVLNVSLQNAGAAVGVVSAGAKQVNTIDLVAPVLNVQQVNQVVFSGTVAATNTFTYGGNGGSYSNTNAVATNAANFLAALNSTAGSKVAFIGGTVLVNDPAGDTVDNVFTYDGISTAGILKVGMSVTGASVPAGTTITAFTATTITLSAAVTAALADNATITIGGGVAGVTVYAPTAGVASPALVFADATIQATTLVTPNVDGTVGDTVSFTYGGVASSYVVQATESATATLLAAAINNITGGASGSATAAVSTNDVTVTANVAGTALPVIVFSGAAGTLPTVTTTTANGAVVGGISFGNNTGIDTLSINNISGQAATITASSVPGATNFTSNASTGAITFSGLSAAQSATKNAGAGNLTAAFSSTVTAGTVNISGGSTAGVVTTSGGVLATNTVNSTGAANTIGALTLGAAVTALNINATTNLTTDAVTNTTAAALTSLTITGVGAVDLSANALQPKVKTINASGNSGGLTVALGSLDSQTVTGSSANDVITTGSLVLTTGSVNAGGGIGDVLDISANVANVNTAALAAKYTGFEILRMNGVMDASLISGITQVQLSDATNTITNLSAAQSVYARADIGATTLVPVAGTTNTLNLTMGNSSKTTPAALGGALTLNGYSTLNLTVTPGSSVVAGAGRTSIIDSFTAANLSTINLSGTSATLTNAATGVAVAINGSALTGNGLTASGTIAGLNVGGNLVAGSSVIGSNLSDQFTTGTEAVTYSGGTGNDLFITSVTNLGTGTATDPTLIGGEGTDTLQISNATVTLADANFKNVTGFEALNLADATGNISITGLNANANAAFATGLTVTAGTAAIPMATAKTFTFDGGLITSNTTLTLITNDAMITNAGSIAITTGVGADTVTVKADSLTGATGGGGNGSLTISTGGGVDTIQVSTGILVANTAQAVQITAGTGADIINVAHVNQGTAAGVGNIMFTIAAGDSTTTAYDTITGFKMSDIGGTGALISDTLDFSSVALASYAATAAAGYTASQLTVSVSAAGVVTLAGTSFNAGLTLQQTIDAVQSVVTTGSGDTALFTYSIAGITSTYVFNNQNSSADSLVMLSGITGGSLITTNDVTTNNGIFIA